MHSTQGNCSHEDPKTTSPQFQDTLIMLLDIKNLSVSFGRDEKKKTVVEDISLSIDRGETVALIGESGSGKSVTALSVLQLLPYPLARHSKTSSIRFSNTELIGADKETIRRIRGNRISMIFQEPMTSLNPLHTIEKQISEVLLLHKGLTKQKCRSRVIELLELVNIPDPKSRLNYFPHQLSGGQRQRVMIAMALANDPDLLIADEPTTAVDVTVQAQLLQLLKDIQKRLGMAILLITHDLRVVSKIASKVYVMQSGKIVESGPIPQTFDAPRHDYTKMLIGSKPSGSAMPLKADSRVTLSVSDLRVWYPIKKGLLRRTHGFVKAVNNVSFTLHEGETLGVVGESGSGKSSLGAACVRLVDSTGEIQLLSDRIDTLSQKELRPHRKHLQIVFQDPFGSLSPRMTVSQIIGEGVTLHGLARSTNELNKIIDQALDDVGLARDSRDRYPHEFSGGQRQRISIARAFAVRPKLIILDEPTSALDLSIQSQIIALLRRLQDKYSMSYLFISHDLSVIKALSHRVIVMKNGQVVEQGETQTLFETPSSNYTKELIAAAMNIDPV